MRCVWMVRVMYVAQLLKTQACPFGRGRVLLFALATDAWPPLGLALERPPVLELGDPRELEAHA